MIAPAVARNGQCSAGRTTEGLEDCGEVVPLIDGSLAVVEGLSGWYRGTRGPLPNKEGGGHLKLGFSYKISIRNFCDRRGT